MNLFDLQDKTIIVTGGKGYLGGEYCRYLTEQGVNVVCWDLPEIDVTRKNSIRQAMFSLEIMPDGLINNAAIDYPPGINQPRFTEITEDEIELLFRTNIIGVLNCCQVVGREMSFYKHGSIINIGSIYGINSPDQRIYDDGFEKPITYTASKSALVGITKYLATYWAKDNIRVNLLTLAGVKKDQPKSFLGKYVEKVPMGRMAEVNEYNGAIHFLLSDASKYMTGANLVMDGGYSAW